MGFTAPFKEFPSHFAHSRRAASNGRDRTNPRVYNELRMGLLPRQTRASLSPGTLTAIKRTLPQPASRASVGQFLTRAGGGGQPGRGRAFVQSADHPGSAEASPHGRLPRPRLLLLYGCHSSQMVRFETKYHCVPGHSKGYKSEAPNKCCATSGSK